MLYEVARYRMRLILFPSNITNVVPGLSEDMATGSSRYSIDFAFRILMMVEVG